MKINLSYLLISVTSLLSKENLYQIFCCVVFSMISFGHGCPKLYIALQIILDFT
jgi:hypothetical protein